MNTRAIIALGLLVLAVVAGAYFAGWLVLVLLGVLHQGHVGWATWWQYFRALGDPQVALYAERIKLAGYVGFGVPLLTWLIVALLLLLKGRGRAFHGDARFARRADLRRAGLLDDGADGVVVGRVGRHLLRLGGTRHAIMTAPTRTGKTTGIAIPVLLTYGHSVVAMDLKGELYALTSGWRAAQGQTIRVFAPYDEGGRTHRFNPLAAMSMDPRVRISEIQTVAAILYPDVPGKDPFWTNQARTAFFAFASCMFERWDAQVAQVRAIAGEKALPDPNKSASFPSFERIYRMSTGVGGRDCKETIQHFLKDPEVRLGDATRTAFAGLASLAEQTFSSVIGSMQEPLQQFLSPILAAATNASDFKVTSLRRQPTTLYVVVPPDKLGEAGKLLNIFFSTVVGQNLKATPQEDQTIKHQVLLLLDEFTSMGRMDVLASRIALTAGYWVRDLSIIQSLSQLDATYGADAARSYLTNHAASIVFTPREQRDAEEYSKQLGDTTVKRRNKTVARGGNVSWTYTEERRALMLPQELKALKPDEELIFLEGCPPIKCTKIRYFKERYFTRRLLPRVEVEALAAIASMPAKRNIAISKQSAQLWSAT